MHPNSLNVISSRNARRGWISLAASLVILACTPVFAQTVTVTQPSNVLQLSAEAQAEVTQDMLTIALQVVREGNDPSVVQQQLRQVLDAALSDARRAEKPGQIAVRTGGFSLHPRYAAPTPNSNKGPMIAGWQGQAELILEGRDIAGISQLAGKLQTMTVQRVAFSLSPEARDQATADLAAQAIQRFKQRATQYAQHFGFGGYAVREVNVSNGEVSGQPIQPMMRMRMSAASESADMAQPVAAGKALVSVTVNGSVQMSAR